MKTLYLIDGHAQFFRAYHAIRTRMTSPVTQEPTNATFGFVGMILKLLRTLGPDYLAVAIDVSGDTQTFRSALYPAYKANRDAPPEDLFPQVDRCVALLKEMGVPVIGIEGFEADDAIATVVARLTKANPDLRIRIVSKDKDLAQLLEDGRVEIYDVHTDKLTDVATLKEDKGITPAQVIDMLALMGDTSDNVPGVPGIGPKTAAELIGRYGSLDAVVAEARKPKSEIKGKRLENILATADALPLSKQLVTLRYDAPVDLTLDEASVSGLHLNRLLPILQELGFHRYQNEVKELLGQPGAADGQDARPTEATIASEQHMRPGPRPKADPGGFGGLFDAVEGGAGSLAREAPRAPDGSAATYRCVRTKTELKELIAELRAAEMIAVDTETTSTRPMRAELCGLSFSTAAGTGWYVPTRSPTPEAHLDTKTVVDALRPILEDPTRPKCGHNIKYDLLVLRRAGVDLRGMEFDSMIASYLIDASRSSHGMDALALALLNHACIPISDLIGSGTRQRTFDTVSVDRAAEYAAEDADITLRLRDVMAPQIRVMGLTELFRDLEMPLIDVLAELEFNGILVDPEELIRQTERLSTRVTALRAQIIDAAPRAFNPDSPKQLSSILFNPTDAAEPGLGLKPIKRTKTGFSTDVEVLEKLAEDPAIGSPIPELLVEYRQLTKLVGTYLVSLREEINPETKRIHASFNQTVAATGRLSSSDPNLQNIPIRSEDGREIRKAFIAAPGNVLISADYSQIELRLLAHLSRDAALIAAFHAGADIHTAVAAQIHGVAPEAVTREQRNGAKMVNFGIVYGVTPWGLGRRLGVDFETAAKIIDDYKKRFAGITTFLAECVGVATRKGYVETMLKRRRPIPEIESANPQRRALAERTAINSVVQGSAADLIKLAMVDLHRRLCSHAADQRSGTPPEISGVRMLLQIHDELVFEVERSVAEEARALIVERMEQAMSLTVPLKVDSAISENWFEGK